MEGNGDNRPDRGLLVWQSLCVDADDDSTRAHPASCCSESYPKALLLPRCAIEPYQDLVDSSVGGSAFSPRSLLRSYPSSSHGGDSWWHRLGLHISQTGPNSLPVATPAHGQTNRSCTPENKHPETLA